MKKLVWDLCYGIIITLIGWILINVEAYPIGLFFIGIGSLITSMITIAMGVNIGINSTKEDNI